MRAFAMRARFVGGLCVSAFCTFANEARTFRCELLRRDGVSVLSSASDTLRISLDVRAQEHFREFGGSSRVPRSLKCEKVVYQHHSSWVSFALSMILERDECKAYNTHDEPLHTNTHAPTHEEYTKHFSQSDHILVYCVERLASQSVPQMRIASIKCARSRTKQTHTTMCQ